jgi:GNAT superfamily N-acetyltransferase
MITNTITVERLTNYSDEVAAGLGSLLPYLYPNNPGMPIDRKRLEAIIASPTSDELVAFKNGQVVGKATVNLIVTELYSKAHLDNFITHPSVRGEGVGIAIWEELVRWAREKGASKITLVSDREEAIQFYLHRGAIKRPDSYFNIPLQG